MAAFTVTLPSGEVWTPQFVTELNQDTCIGCGRCFRVCARDVLQLVGLTDEGERVALDSDDDDDEYEKRVMTVAHPENCVGCEACAKICPKKCYTHAPATAC
ncbi:MAG TPA: ferredoxin III, nif-specific [Burkholderiales bacterium]|nr:ferredoxin III, nif-specific [Betaproteobacteria bacterium]HQR54103.1 ferredoxin III, nif-specific [Burkholderiales bacterium]